MSVRRHLLVFESHPVQYHAPVYAELSRQCLGFGATVKVYYGTDMSVRGYFDRGFQTKLAWNETLMQGYEYGVLNNERGLELRGAMSLTGAKILRILTTDRPDAILVNQLAYLFDWTALLGALALGIPVWIRTETQDRCFPRTAVKARLRSLIYRMLYSQMDTFFSIGWLNHEHFTSHGVPGSRIVFSRYCTVDRITRLRPTELLKLRRATRRLMGFSAERKLVLFCGKLQTKKDPALILAALALFPTPTRSRYAAVFVGAGVLENELRLQAKATAIDCHFSGFKNQDELTGYYAAADILVLPSRQQGETWGLVVNEALQAGCAVALSSMVGCAADFGHWARCRVFAPGDSAGCAAAIGELASFPRQFSWCRQLMEDYSVSRAGVAIAEVLRRLPPGESGGGGCI